MCVCVPLAARSSEGNGIKAALMNVLSVKSKSTAEKLKKARDLARVLDGVDSPRDGGAEEEDTGPDVVKLYQDFLTGTDVESKVASLTKQHQKRREQKLVEQLSVDASANTTPKSGAALQTPASMGTPTSGRAGGSALTPSSAGGKKTFGAFARKPSIDVGEPDSDSTGVSSTQQRPRKFSGAVMSPIVRAAPWPQQQQPLDVPQSQHRRSSSGGRARPELHELRVRTSLPITTTLAIAQRDSLLSPTSALRPVSADVLARSTSFRSAATPTASNNGGSNGADAASSQHVVVPPLRTSTPLVVSTASPSTTASRVRASSATPNRRKPDRSPPDMLFTVAADAGDSSSPAPLSASLRSQTARPSTAASTLQRTTSSQSMLRNTFQPSPIIAPKSARGIHAFVDSINFAESPSPHRRSTQSPLMPTKAQLAAKFPREHTAKTSADIAAMVRESGYGRTGEHWAVKITRM